MDATQLGIMNLGGNIAEWVADVFGPYDAPCWNTGALLVSPVCTMSGGTTVVHSLRGGSWQAPAFEALSYIRDSSATFDRAAAATGFRCAVDM